MKKKSRVILLFFLVPLLAFSALLISAMQNSAAYYYTIEELHYLDSLPRSVRIKGELVVDSVHYEAGGPRLEFTLAQNGYQVAAVCPQPMPDNFLHSDEVIIEGHLDSDNIFRVSKLMLQCPSKYEAEAD